MTISKLDTRIGSRRAPFLVGSFDGFSDQILRKDRNCFGGGVLVYTSQDICVKPRYDLNFASGEIIAFLHQ
jgi:hypothetical protein